SVAYYAQAAWGGLRMLAADRSIEKVLGDPATPEGLKRQLEVVVGARAFASAELLLPDNGSYRRYAEIDREYATWVVTAAPELSLEPVSWCFPVAGCVSYRGYFSERRARLFASRLDRRGFDVTVSGVRAFSTLGWFRDPVLSTFVFDSPPALAGVLFHELAHQKVYIKGDTRFNESFATFVENEGVRRWLTSRGELEAIANYESGHARRSEAITLLLAYRKRLEVLYAGESKEEEKRAAKRSILNELGEAYRDLEESWSAEIGGSAEPAKRLWNNADLVAIEAYNQWTPAFGVLLKESAGELASFYGAVEAIAELTPEARETRIRDLLRDLVASSESRASVGVESSAGAAFGGR
ncbi:MAG: aminopeptidase, partial [Acidobacteriota bacterium]|nr:aminopeptidase [Acidobacteriota bacterium]